MSNTDPHQPTRGREINALLEDIISQYEESASQDQLTICSISTVRQDVSSTRVIRPQGREIDRELRTFVSRCMTVSEGS